MQADKQLIEWLLNDSGQTVSGIAKGSEVAYMTVSDLKNRKSNIDKMSFEIASKLTIYAKTIKGAIKMNTDKIENYSYISMFDDLGDYVDEDGNFTNQADFVWWTELADSLAYLEKEQGINTLDLEVNELQDYIDLAKKQKAD